MSPSATLFAPELAVSEWFNTAHPLTLSDLRGQVVFLHAFQLLCPGCVSEALPQLRRIEQVFRGTELQIIGLHTVFEHHDAMTPVTLKAFIHEYRLTTPIGVDLHDGTSDVPVTMRRYCFRGTPSSVLIGRDGSILHHAFGVEDDIVVGARIATALASPIPEKLHIPEGNAQPDGCEDGTCAAPSAVANA
ncbi:redoxin domain-containing protein [Neorhizobium galegae]|uniref:redoxin domain-containing protein n=1 Tax=Neorhizobium galegae TaxID=399 RepID=UPI002DD43D2A|nr:redoxin domain-containing protein [Neorhizobium galegae]